MRRLAVLAALALALPAASSAAFPGTNGRLIFTQARTIFERSAPPTADACATTPNGVRPTRIATAAPGQLVAHPTVTAEGDAFAYSRAGSIFVAGPDGAGERPLAVGTSPAWTPDGTRVYYAHQGDLYSVRRDASDHRL